MKNGKLLYFSVISGMFLIFQMADYGTTMVYGNSNSLMNQPDNSQLLYKQHMANGDKYLAEKNYAAAMFEYEKASNLMPYEDEPRLKMQSIEATLGINELAEVFVY